MIVQQKDGPLDGVAAGNAGETSHRDVALPQATPE